MTSSMEQVGSLNDVLASGQSLNQLPTGVVLHDHRGRVVDVNDVALAMLGLDRDELIGREIDDPAWGMMDERGRPLTYEDSPILRTLTSGEPTNNVVLTYSNERVGRRWILTNAGPVTLLDGSTGVAVTFVDVTAPIRTRHLLELFGAVNATVREATDESEFLERLCEVIVDVGHFALAWIGVSDEAGEGVRIEASAGRLDYLAEGLASSERSTMVGFGPAGETIRQGLTQVRNDLSHELTTPEWRALAERHQLGSSISLHLHLHARQAALTIYSPLRHAFDEEMVRQFESLISETQFGLEHVRAVRATEQALSEMTAALAAKRESDSRLGESEQRFRLAFEGNMAPMLFLGVDNEVIAANDAFCDLLGRTRDEVLGALWPAFTHPEDAAITARAHDVLVSGEQDQIRYTKRYIHRDGHVIVVDISRYAARDEHGKLRYSVLSARDVTEERALADQLSRQALYDPLTGLANRALLQDRLAQAIGRTGRQSGLGAVLYVDLDDFSTVNEAHGHLVGDQLLVGVARRFELVTRASDTLCRFGGDEFLFLAESLSGVEEAEEVAQRLLDVLADPFIIDGVQFEQTASIGVVTWDDARTSVDEVLRNADSANFEAKRRGKGRVVVFTPDIHNEAVSRFAMGQELRQALRGDTLSMHYQPIVNLRTGDIAGFESLMRWRHPLRGPISPAVFIPLAEGSDLIVELGNFALHEAIFAAASWDDRGERGAPFVTVNLSARQFSDPTLVANVERELHLSGLDPSRLIIEVTERTTLYDLGETLLVIERLASLGVRIALDDFGTGYSSLAYLIRLNPKIVKIDGYFVSPTVESENNEALLETIVALGSKLGVIMVAEGVETAAQAEMLLGMGCHYGQGFHFSPAVPAAEVHEMLAAPRPRS